GMGIFSSGRSKGTLSRSRSPPPPPVLVATLASTFSKRNGLCLTQLRLHHLARRHRGAHTGSDPGCFFHQSGPPSPTRLVPSCLLPRLLHGCGRPAEAHATLSSLLVRAQARIELDPYVIVFS